MALSNSLNDRSDYNCWSLPFTERMAVEEVTDAGCTNALWATQ